jgi:hypothetical protein
MPWMPAGSGIEILTARDDIKSPSIFVEAQALSVDETKNIAAIKMMKSADAAVFQHPLGVHRVTAVRLVSPASYQPPPAVIYLDKLGQIKFTLATNGCSK